MKMNTSELFSLGRAITNSFEGVFSRDQVPRRPFCLIFNSETQYQSGAHWMAYYRNPQTHKLEFFCSYGSKPPHKPKAVSVITESIQAPGSSVCGQHALYFLHQRVKGLPLEYTQDNKKNDKFVNDWLRMTYGVQYPIMDRDFLVQQIAKTFASQ